MRISLARPAQDETNTQRTFVGVRVHMEEGKIKYGLLVVFIYGVVVLAVVGGFPLSICGFFCAFVGLFRFILQIAFLLFIL